VSVLHDTDEMTDEEGNAGYKQRAYAGLVGKMRTKLELVKTVSQNSDHCGVVGDPAAAVSEQNAHNELQVLVLVVEEPLQRAQKQLQWRKK